MRNFAIGNFTHRTADFEYTGLKLSDLIMAHGFNIEHKQIQDIQAIHFSLSECATIQSLYETVLNNINVLLEADHSFFHGINKYLKPVSRGAYGFEESNSNFFKLLDKLYDGYYELDPIYNYLIEHAGESKHQIVFPQDFISDDEYKKSDIYKELINPYIDYIGSLDHVLCLSLRFKASHCYLLFLPGKNQASIYNSGKALAGTDCVAAHCQC